MFETYLKWNKSSIKWLWALVVIGMIACVPLAVERIWTEQSANRVEIVYDIADLLTISEYKQDPQAFLHQSLDDLKEAGVNTIAIYESTLSELQQSGRLQVYTPREATLLLRESATPGRNNTFLLFREETAADKLAPMIKESMAAAGIAVQDWSANDRQGLLIEAPYARVFTMPMQPDPILLADLKAKGFTLAARLSDKRNLSLERLDEEMQMLQAHDVTYIVFAGVTATGFSDDAEKRTLTQVAELLGKYDFRIGMIETDPSKPGQKGVAKLAYLTDYDVVRLHSISEAEMFQSAGRLADRIVLAVTDRNIRMIYLNGAIQRDADTGALKDTLHNTVVTLKGENGAIQRLKDQGYTIGTADPFTIHESPFDRWLKLVALVGAVAVIALLIGMFLVWSRLAVYVIGLIGAAGLYVLSPKLLLQALALGVSISAPSLAFIIAMRKLTDWGRQREGFKDMQESGPSAWVKAVVLFIRSAFISLTGIILTVGLLQSITFMLAIDVFRGVSLLKLMPVAIVAIYYVLFLQTDSLQGVMDRAKTILMANIKVVYVVLVGLIGLIGLYYLSRAGNAGSTLPGEREFRAFLEHALGVRPRTQEFLIGHPLFILGAYAYIRYRKGLFLMLPGIIGLLNMVNTFSHIHTPLDISGLRMAYGIVLGILVSIVLVLILELLARSWRRWSPLIKQL